MDLTEIRKQLDQLDAEWLKIIAKRLTLIPEVAKFKIENNIPRYQPKREKEMIVVKRKLAEKLGVNPDLAEDILKLIIKESHRIEKEIMGN
jgi:chorismate mutase/prephenate dehydrogenase